MDAVERIRALDGAEVRPQAENAWGPSGRIAIDSLEKSGTELRFELLVPTSQNDIWDYIWKSEKEQGSTEKVQLFQSGERIAGSSVTAISREGEADRWDAPGPEQYRLKFSVPVSSVSPDAPVEVHFFWSEQLMSIAGGS
jgi:hypothetical protein